MSLPKSDYVSNVWRDDIFSRCRNVSLEIKLIANPYHQKNLENKVLFCTGGAGSICSTQVRAMVHLGANACIVGRNVEKTENMAKDIAAARTGATVIGIGSVDVRSFDSLNEAVKRCVEKLGAIDFVMYANAVFLLLRLVIYEVRQCY